MSAKHIIAAAPIALGLRAMRGGAVTVGVVLEKNQPRVVLSSFLATGGENDRLAFEPYHVAAEMKRAPAGKASAEARAAVAEGRKRQGKLAARGVKGLVRELSSAGERQIFAALLINRAGWMTDLLDYSLASPEHVAVAEGLAVREALRPALRGAGIAFTEMDEKSLPHLAAEMLRLGPAALDARLKTLGVAAGRPWRKEQKLACLAAWVTLANSH